VISGRASLDRGGLRAGAEKHEHGDQHQQRRVVVEREQSSDHRDRLPDARGHPGAPHQPHPARQERAQQSAAVQRKRRKQVEQQQHHVGQQELSDERQLADVGFGKLGPKSAHRHP